MKKLLKFLLVWVACTTLCAGCNNIENNDIDLVEQPFEITPILIGKGELQGREGISKQNMVITENKDWEELKATMNLVNNVTEKFTENTIDFSKYQLIAVFEEVKNNGGWSIDITKITEYKDKIVILITNLKKGNLTSVIDQPFHIVKIPASKKEMVFENN
ncbi:MAG TPA: protease complex subunit PrcB family protein [Ignavibacteria bacterium]|nr:protease complex subunit PrcB family protein [Ignavibacteria bacterium]